MKSEVISQKSGTIKKYCPLPLAPCLVFCFFLFALISGCASTKDEISKNSDPALLYAEGETLYHNGDYTEAIDKFKKVMEDYPLSPFAVDAELALADTYYGSSQYSDAASYYASFLSLHPGHQKAAYAMFQKGMSYLREVSTVDRDQTAAQKALLAFSDTISMYPSSVYVDKAKEMAIFLKRHLAEREFYIGNFYFKDKKYKGALARFAEILKKYPDAGISDKALYYIGKSYIGLGEKDLARETFSTLIASFPDSSFALEAKSWLSDSRDI